MNKCISTLILLLICVNLLAQDSVTSKKILIVATNIDRLGKNENGTYLIEIAYPFQYFIDHGYDVDVVTPKGGQTAIYPKEYSESDARKIPRSDVFVAKTNNSLAPAEVKSSDYCAVYYPGGYGQFFDVVDNVQISNLTVHIYQQGGIIGTAGHGAASLTNIKVSTNTYFVEGKKLTCFPWWTEITNMKISEYGKLVPFNMEEVLVKRGAHLIVCSSGDKVNMECSKISDEKNRIVTASYADDALWVAEHMHMLITAKKN